VYRLGCAALGFVEGDNQGLAAGCWVGRRIGHSDQGVILLASACIVEKKRSPFENQTLILHSASCERKDQKYIIENDVF